MLVLRTFPELVWRSVPNLVEIGQAVSVCWYLTVFLFHTLTAWPISTKFGTDLHTNSGKVLNTSMTLSTWPPDPRVPQTPKPKWFTGEKTLCNVKCPDGWRKLIKFFPGSAGARLASIYIKQTVCTYVYLPVFLFHMLTARPTSAKFCADLYINSGKVLNTSLSPPTWPPDTGGTPNSKTINRSQEKKLCFTKNVLNFFRTVPGLIGAERGEGEKNQRKKL